MTKLLVLRIVGKVRSKFVEILDCMSTSKSSYIHSTTAQRDALMVMTYLEQKKFILSRFQYIFVKNRFWSRLLSFRSKSFMSLEQHLRMINFDEEVIQNITPEEVATILLDIYLTRKERYIILNRSWASKMTKKNVFMLNYELGTVTL